MEIEFEDTYKDNEEIRTIKSFKGTLKEFKEILEINIILKEKLRVK